MVLQRENTPCSRLSLESDEDVRHLQNLIFHLMYHDKITARIAAAAPAAAAPAGADLTS